jgi:hypothetical protein
MAIEIILVFLLSSAAVMLVSLLNHRYVLPPMLVEDAPHALQLQAVGDNMRVHFRVSHIKRHLRSQTTNEALHEMPLIHRAHAEL